ncbi:hypothetical protein R3P38DRAFT_2810593 [Favolaschia claudopus]|uniref:Uncharacterized protein n=1 Tax=Favolaschia claudopus TaxID=2862362 RepID=A0AAV9ZAV9_9AGAR
MLADNVASFTPPLESLYTPELSVLLHTQDGKRKESLEGSCTNDNSSLFLGLYTVLGMKRRGGAEEVITQIGIEGGTESITIEPEQPDMPDGPADEGHRAAGNIPPSGGVSTSDITAQPTDISTRDPAQACC